MAGRLHLLPAWLADDTAPERVIAPPALDRIRALDTFVVENAKSARAFLAACRHPRPIRELSLRELNEHTPREEIPALLQPLLDGKDVGLLSEAGLPAIADPGAELVEAAHARGIAVVPHVGPSSIALALMASGLEGQRFRFLGYLPAQSGERRSRLAEIERQSARDRETQIFIETPYRNEQLLADIVAACRPETRLCVAAELTSPNEWIVSARVGEWKARAETIGKRPAIFLLLA